MLYSDYLVRIDFFWGCGQICLPPSRIGLRGQLVLSHDMFWRPVLTSSSTWRQELWQHVETFSRFRGGLLAVVRLRHRLIPRGGNLEGGKRSHLWSPISVTADCSIDNFCSLWEDNEGGGVEEKDRGLMSSSGESEVIISSPSLEKALS